MDNYTILIWSPQASLVTELQDSNIYCTVDLLLGKFIGVCQYWQAMSNNTTGTI